MKTLNDECVLVDRLKCEDLDKIVTIGDEEKCKQIIETFFDDEKFKYWIECSGKADPPPDYFSDKFGLMMDVMRVDDCAYVNDKNKIINKTLQAENLKIKELKELFDEPNNINMIVVANSHSGLSTNEDHNYKRYYSNFKRVVNKHKESIPLYKKNHNQHELIFYIFDESTAYLEAPNMDAVKQDYQYNEINFDVKIHEFYLDNRFIETIRNCGADFVIWYAPYKYVNTLEYGYLDIPRVIIYDVKAINCESEFKYDENLMISAEA